MTAAKKKQFLSEDEELARFEEAARKFRESIKGNKQKATKFLLEIGAISGN